MVKKVQISKESLNSLNKNFKTIYILPSGNVNSESINEQMKPQALMLKKVKIPSSKKNANTQTDWTEFKMEPEHLNIFFCTFHSSGDAETYCDIHPSERICHVRETFPKTEPEWPVFQNSPHEDDFDNIEHKYMEETNLKTEQLKTVRDMIISTEAEVNSLEKFRPTSKLTKNLRKKSYQLGTNKLRKVSESLLTLKNKQKIRRTNSFIFNCSHCPKEFSSFYQLEKHTKLVHDSSDFSIPCSLCNATFTRAHNLSRHLETKHSNGVKKFACSQCKQRFSRRDSLATHTQFVHSIETVRQRKLDDTDSVHHCSSCNKYFVRIQNLDNHRKGNLSCAKCSQKFPCKAELQNHLYKYHSASCACGKVCANKRQLYFHKLTHSPRYKCQYCGKVFLWDWNYTIHLATHTGIKPLKCKICNKSFAHKYAVTKHIWQEHTESNKKFPCEFCGKSFVYKAKLKSHLRSHTGEKPFQCHLCSSSFSQNYNLTAHIKSVHAMNHHFSKKDGLKSRKGGKKSSIKLLVEPPIVDNACQDVNESYSSSVVLTEFPESKSKEEIKVYTSQALAESFNDNEAPYQVIYAFPNPVNSD